MRHFLLTAILAISFVGNAHAQGTGDGSLAVPRGVTSATCAYAPTVSSISTALLRASVVPLTPANYSLAAPFAEAALRDLALGFACATVAANTWNFWGGFCFRNCNR